MVQRVFRQAFAICSTRAFLLPSLVVPAGLAIVQRAVAPASIPAGALGVPTPLHFSTVILAIVAPLLSLWVSASLLSLGIAVARGEHGSLVDRLVSVGVYVRLVVVSTAIFLVGAIGCLLLLLPGIFVCVVWSQAWALIVDDRASCFDALERSQDLTRESRGEVFATMLCGFILSAVFLGVWFAFFLHWTTRVPSWPMTLLAIVWFAPMGAFTTALSAALYVNLLALTRPLTRAEFFLAPTEAELPH